MPKKNLKISVPDEIVLNKIYVIRDEKVMLDRDLAELYGVETRVLKQAVKRNMNRFPEDFMFEMTKEELQDWRSQFVTSNSTDAMGLRHIPFVFTEQGVAQLSSVLNSERAIAVNIQIIRVVYQNAQNDADPSRDLCAIGSDTQHGFGAGPTDRSHI